MATCLIGLGSNLGDRATQLQSALRRLSEHSSVSSLIASTLHGTQPAGGPAGQDDFLNAAARIETSLPAQAMLELLLEIEANVGRTRGERWGARVIDLDLLLYEDHVLDTPSLQLPHPRMAFRRFVLVPAVEVAADMVHPIIGWNIQQLVEHLEHSINYVAVTGAIGTGKTSLVRQVQRDENINWIRDSVDQSMLSLDLHNLPEEVVKTELQLAASRLQNLSQLTGDSPATISDFWFDQSLAFARTWLSGAMLEQFERSWVEMRERVPSPKLLIVLDVATHHSQESSGESATSQIKDVERTLHDLIAQRHEGPILTLRDRSTAAAETSAALQAMKC